MSIELDKCGSILPVVTRMLSYTVLVKLPNNPVQIAPEGSEHHTEIPACFFEILEAFEEARKDVVFAMSIELPDHLLIRGELLRALLISIMVHRLMV